MFSTLRVKDYSETDKLVTVIKLFCENVKKPDFHKHNQYFEIIFITNGQGVHTVDQTGFKVSPPVVFFIRPDHVHDFRLRKDSDPKGFILMIKKNLIDRSLDGDLKSLFAKLNEVSCLYLSDPTTIQVLFELLEKDCKENKRNYFITEGLLKALFATFVQAENESAASIRPSFFRSFQELLRTDIKIENNVAYYAKKLHTTPQNLNIICRKATNQSAAELIAQYIIGEGKRLLLHTNNTVSEISFALNFKDPSHFIKYFKRHTTYTPKKFRNSASDTILFSNRPPLIP